MKNRKSKYLEEIPGIDNCYIDVYNPEYDKTYHKRLKKERKKFGVDSRNTIALGGVLHRELYVYLRMFQDTVPGTSEPDKFEYHGEIYKFEELVDLCIGYLAIAIISEWDIYGMCEIATSLVCEVMSIIWLDLWW